MRPTILIGAGAVLLLVVGLASALWLDGWEYSPMSLVVVLPMILTWDLFGAHGAWMGASVAPIMFLLVARHVRRSRVSLPHGLSVVFGIIVAGSILWAASGWKPTVAFTSKDRAIALVLQSLSPPVALGAYAYVRRKQLRMSEALLLHWVALLWFAWSAFPWYGELL